MKWPKFWKKEEEKKEPTDYESPEGRLKITRWYLWWYKYESRSKFWRVIKALDNICFLINHYKLDVPLIKKRLAKFEPLDCNIIGGRRETQYYLNKDKEKVEIKFPMRARKFTLKIGTHTLTFKEIEEFYNEVKDKVVQEWVK